MGCVAVLSGCSLLRAQADPDVPAAATPAAASAPQPAESPPGASADAAVPEAAALEYQQALSDMNAGRGTQAKNVLLRLSADYPQFAGPQINLGLLYERESRLPEAESAFKAALERNPGNAVADNELGIVERKLGRFAQAEAAYRQAIASQPAYAPAYLNLGVLYDLYLAEPQKALEQFEHYLDLVGDNKQVAGWVVELRKRVGSPPAKKEPA